MMEDHDQEERGDGERGDLEPVLERLHQGDAFHATAGDPQRHDDTEHDDADPLGSPESDLKGQPCAFELRQQVEAADDEHGAGGRPAQLRRLQTPFGEVRDRVGAEPAERCGDGDEEDQIAGRVPDGVPKGAETFEHGQPRNPEKGGGGQVLARNG